LGVAVKQPRLALGSATIDNNLFNSSETFCNYKIFIFHVQWIQIDQRMLKSVLLEIYHFLFTLKVNRCYFISSPSIVDLIETLNIYLCFYILVPYSPPDNFLIKPVDSKHNKSSSFSLWKIKFLFVAWSSLDLDRVHLTPKQESRTNSTIKILKLINLYYLFRFSSFRNSL